MATINKLETIPEAEISRDVGIVIFAIGIGMSNSEDLRGIAGSKKNTFFIDKFEDLGPSLDAIKTSICYGSMFLYTCTTNLSKVQPNSKSYFSITR